MTWSSVFSLRWTSALNAGAKVTREYHMMLADSQHANRLSLSGIMTNLDGESIIIRVPFRPRVAQGMVRIRITNDAWGPLDELEEASGATDLEAKLWRDTAFWPAIWTNSWEPNHLDPLGGLWYAPMALQQKSRVS